MTGLIVLASAVSAYLTYGITFADIIGRYQDEDKRSAHAFAVGMALLAMIPVLGWAALVAAYLITGFAKHGFRIW